MLVGEIACYLIEAIIRHDPYFTRTGLLLTNKADITTWAGRQQALIEAADEYERWYLKCFDQSNNSIVCDEADRPTISWDGAK
jgi:hypothetical protein